jgi:hypothetical protein
MTFYRVEKDGKGPYAGDCPIINYLQSKGHLRDGNMPASYENARPVPSSDSILAPAWDRLGQKQETMVFGFAKFDDIFAWFSLKDEIEFFRIYGYKIVTYDVKTMIKGSKQAVAPRAELVLIDSREF